MSRIERRGKMLLSDDRRADIVRQNSSRHLAIWDMNGGRNDAPLIPTWRAIAPKASSRAEALGRERSNEL